MKGKRSRIKDLSAKAVDSKPISVDWSERSDWTAYEEVWCDGDRGNHRNIVAISEREWRGGAGCKICRTWIFAEGPMMDWWYPVEIGNTECAAEAIGHLPLCVVEFYNGDTGLALTGGGMDFSWEICEAFMCLGYLPPLHFVPPPEVCGRGDSPRDRWILSGCRASARVAAVRAQNRSRELLQRMRRKGKK